MPSWWASGGGGRQCGGGRRGLSPGEFPGSPARSLPGLVRNLLFPLDAEAHDEMPLINGSEEEDHKSDDNYGGHGNSLDCWPLGGDARRPAVLVSGMGGRGEAGVRN